MWDEEEDVDEEGQQCQEESQNAENEDPEQIAWRVRWRMQVRYAGEDQHDESEETCDRVDNKDLADGFACCDWDAEVFFEAVASKEWSCDMLACVDACLSLLRNSAYLDHIPRSHGYTVHHYNTQKLPSSHPYAPRAE